MPKTGKREVEAILEKRVSNKTRSQSYYHYLIKWKGQRVEDASSMTAVELQKLGVDSKHYKISFLPRESDAGALGLSQQCDVLFTCCG